MTLESADLDTEQQYDLRAAFQVGMARTALFLVSVSYLQSI
jgi:hypothetical protein